jgi:hypothetical protein
MAIHLFDANLGSDDEPPTHALLFDRQTAAVYVGEYSEVRRFVRSQHPPRRPPTPEEVAEMNKHLAEMSRMNLDDLRELGAFEFFLGPKPEQQDRCTEMVIWLDEFITEELINSYLAAAGAGDARAIYHLHRFQLRMKLLLDDGAASRWTH